MLILGIILIVIGVLVGYAVPRYGPQGYGNWGYGPGGLLVLIGIILVILAVLGIAL